MMEIIINISFICMLICLPINLISLWSCGIVSGKHFDSKLKELDQNLPLIMIASCSDRSARAICYLFLILSNGNPFIRKNYRWYYRFIKPYLISFGIINYRALARKRDWMMAILYWGSLVIFIVSLVIGCVTSALSGSA